MTTFLQSPDTSLATALESSASLEPVWTPPGPPAESRLRRGLSRRALMRAYACIETHLGDGLTLTDIARAAGVSRFHFARLFRVSTGLSPMEYRLHLRIEQAKRMLDRADMPICEIAVTLGFCDQSHFSRTFRRVTGLTPRDFARQQADLDYVDATATWTPSTSQRAPCEKEHARANRSSPVQALAATKYDSPRRSQPGFNAGA